MLQSLNDQIRAAAGLAIQKLIRDKGDNVFTWAEINNGFEVAGNKIHFATKAAGIFKPKELTDDAALSVKQVRPSRRGRDAPYQDKELNNGIVSYQLEGTGEETRFNRTLEQAHKKQLPLIFFRGISDGLYEAFYPVYVEDFSYPNHEALLVFDAPSNAAGNLSGNAINETNELVAEYTFSQRRNRLHQKAFRQRILSAYGLRCALTNLPLVDLLEAAHIISDSKGGPPSVQNGIAMTTFHHTAFEANLMGIDPDGKIVLNSQVRGTRDGPMFNHGLLELEGRKIRFPTYVGHHPSRDFLALKFDEFLAAQ